MCNGFPSLSPIPASGEGNSRFRSQEREFLKLLLGAIPLLYASREQTEEPVRDTRRLKEICLRRHEKLRIRPRPFGHTLECELGAVHRRRSLGCDTKKAFRTSTTLWRRVAAVGLDVPFRLQPIKGGIDSANGHLALGAEFDLLAHWNSICSLSQPQECQDNDVLEFAEVVADGHFLYKYSKSRSVKLRDRRSCD